MSALRRIFAPRAAITSSHHLAELLRGSTESDSGASVTSDSAMRVASVYACVNVVAQDVAKLPLLTYRREGDGKSRATDHWLYRLLHDEPNPWQTSFEFREMMQAHLELAGNAYAIMTVVRGEVRELLPIAPSRVTVEQLSTYQLLYLVDMLDGSRLTVPAERMFHLRGLSLDGITGVSPIRYQREAVGLAIQLMKQGAKIFKNGAMPGGVLSHPGTMKKEAYDRLKDSFDATYAGVDNLGKTVLLEDGVTFTRTGLSMVDAQFLDQRKLSRSEIASIYRIPPHKIGDLERATFTNIEHQAIEYVGDALLPRLRRWESRVTKTLIPERERATVFAEFLVDGLLRGDFATRMKGFEVAVKTGWMNRNEVRAIENMNPAEGLDEFLTPSTSAGAAGEDDGPDAKPEPAPQRRFA